MHKTRVLVADDHAILRAGLRLLIDEQPDMEVVGEAASSDETIDKAGELVPDVVTLDVTMPGGPFGQTIRRLPPPGPPAIRQATGHRPSRSSFRSCCPPA